MTANQNSFSLKQDLQENSIESHEEVFTHSIVSLFFRIFVTFKYSSMQLRKIVINEISLKIYFLLTLVIFV